MTTSTEELSRHMSYDLLGIRLQPFTRDELIELIGQIIESDGRAVIAHHNLHSLYIYHHDQRMREFYALARFIHIDGMALVGIGRLLGMPLRRAHRSTYIDFQPQVMKVAADSGWRVFYLGSKPGVAERGAALFRQRYPSLKIRTAHGYFDATPNSAETAARLKEIQEYRPDVLLVGMGMPRQETWILQNIERIGAHAILCAGACMDYFAGEIPTPPRWIGALGFEWAYRLASEPKRLWRRYLVEPWFLLSLLPAHVIQSARRKRPAP